MAELMMSRREIRPLPVRMDATSPSSILPVQPTAMLPIGSPKRISPLDLRLSARSSRRPTYCSALGIAIRVLLTLITDSLVSIAVAWLVAYLLTLGNVFSGLPAAGQSYSSFMVATTMLSTLCTAQAMLLVQALSLTPLHLSGRPGKKIELLSIWWKLQQRCLSMFVVTEVVTGLFTYAVTSAGEPFSDWHLEYYAANWAVALHRSAAAVESKRIFQLDTVEGRARGRVNTSPYHVRLLRAYCSASFLPATMTIAGAVVQVSMRLRISTNRGLVLFSLASLALKSTALWATRTFAARRRRRIDIQSVYIYTVVPTVLINTQVRLFLLRTKPQLSISGFLALALIEPVLRAVKLIFIEREINRHHHEFNMKYSRPMASWSWHPVVRMASQIQTAHVAVASASSGPHLMFGGKHQQQIGQHSLGEIVSRTATSNLTPGQMFAQWRATVMQFHAAEIEADMCSEYIAIGCSLAINHFFQVHPKLGWSAPPSSEPPSINQSGNVALVETLLKSSLGIGAIQVLLEVVVDVFCSIVELRRGVALSGAPTLRFFLAGTFTGCTIATISVCAAIYAKDNHLSSD